jgi:CubicO group peptidase (beta-lactamase class C family)
MEDLQALDRFLTENVKGVSVDAKAVLAHVIRPPHYDDVSSDGGTEQSNVPCEPVQPPGVRYSLDVGAFETALDNALKNDVAGYVAQLRQSGTMLFTSMSQYAIRRSEPWSPDVKMHVASVSKLMTAMAMMVLFNDNNISPDARIIDYLPKYWAKGSNIESITFRNLFNHTSGLSANYLVEFDMMKSAIAGGINLNDLGNYNYQNLNYGLCRILLAVINGNINKDKHFPVSSLNDRLWDLTTIKAYEEYLQAKVFQPSGVGDATLDHPPGCALAYRGPPVDIGPGWNSGSLQQSCGCDGWHLSVNELLNVMGEFRRGNGILGSGDAQTMLDNGFGVDPLCGNSALPTGLATLAGNVYCKPGDWRDKNGPPARDEQSLAFFLPQDMELVVFVNSMVDGQTGATNKFREVVKRAYLDNLVPSPPPHV